MDFGFLNNGISENTYSDNISHGYNSYPSNAVSFYGQPRQSCLSHKDIQILQLKTRIKNLEHQLSQRDLIIQMLEHQLEQKRQIEAETEISRKDIVIKLLEKEIDEMEETIEEHEEMYDDICDKTGYECLWERESSSGHWDAFDGAISAKIEKLAINETIEYKSKSGDYQIITKLSADRGIEQNLFDVDGSKKYIRRIEKFGAIHEQKLQIEQKEKLISTQQKEIKSLTVKMEEINKKIGHIVTWEWQENANKSQWISYNHKVSETIEKLEVKEEFEYEHDRNKNQIYVITKTAIDSAEQMNKVTKYKRAVRRIERYEKLVCLDGAQIDYPKYWDMASQTISDYARPKLVNISDRALFNEISARFHYTVSPRDYVIVKIEGVQNQMLYDKYCQERVSVIKLNGKNGLNEKYLFHGTKQEDLERNLVQRMLMDMAVILQRMQDILFHIVFKEMMELSECLSAR